MVVCSIGEVLWDIFPEQELLGGAAFNVCANLQRLGDRAILLSAIGDDPRGELALKRMQEIGVSTSAIQIIPNVPTGTASVHTGADGEPSFVIDRPAAYDYVSVPPGAAETLESSNVDWVYYGTLLQTTPAIERLTTELIRSLKPARGFYDINLRTGHWNFELVQRLSRLASVIKLNETEARVLSNLTRPGDEVFDLEAFCREWAATYAVDVICVTLGSAGCLICDGQSVIRIPGYPVTVRDTVGSGDAFAAGFLHGYQGQWGMAKTARFANALGALVASMAGATPAWSPAQLLDLLKNMAQ